MDGMDVGFTGQRSYKYFVSQSCGLNW